MSNVTETAARTARNAQLHAKLDGNRFEIVETIALRGPEAGGTDKKFSAWITGARGYNGFAIMNVATGAIHIVGATLIEWALANCEAGTIVNPNYVGANGRVSRATAQDETVNASANADLIARIQAKRATTESKPVDAPVSLAKRTASKAVEAK